MIISMILLFSILMGGGAVSGLSKQLEADRKNAEAVLKGTDQQKTALQILEAMQKVSASSGKEAQKLSKEGLKAGRDHARPSSEIGALMEAHDEEMAAFDRSFLDKRDALRVLLSREQWNGVFRSDTLGTWPKE